MPYSLPARLAGLYTSLHVTLHGRDVVSSALVAPPPGVTPVPLPRLLASRLRSRLRPQQTMTPPVDTVVLIGDGATTLVVEAIIAAGMARHYAFGVQTAKHKPHSALPSVLRTTSWADAAELVERTDGCVVVAQAGFLPPEFSSRNERIPLVQVIDAESLIAASV